MTVLAGLAVFALLVWGVLTVGRGMFWRTSIRLDGGVLDRGGAFDGGWPSVTVVVPARDEAEILPTTMPTLLAQSYPGPLRVVLVDDASTDGTGDVARAVTGPVPLTVLTGGERPAGWAGKVWALEQGVTATDGEWLLFTDADIAHPSDSVLRLVRHATGRGLDMVSLMAVLRTGNRWERLIVPAFVYYFAQLYPFRWSNRPRARTAAAAGGCVLVRRDALDRAGGLRAIHSAIIDDCSLARVVKDSGGRIWLGFADPDGAGPRSVRPYPELGDLWRMVARSAYTQLRHSPVILSGTVLGLVLIYLVPPVAAVAGLLAGMSGVASPVAALAGLLAWALMVGTYVPMVRYYRQPAALAFTLPAVAVLYLLMTLDSARAHRLGRGGVWKGRAHPASTGPG